MSASKPSQLSLYQLFHINLTDLTTVSEEVRRLIRTQTVTDTPHCVAVTPQLASALSPSPLLYIKNRECYEKVSSWTLQNLIESFLTQTSQMLNALVLF